LIRITVLKLSIILAVALDKTGTKGNEMNERRRKKEKVSIYFITFYNS